MPSVLSSPAAIIAADQTTERQVIPSGWVLGALAASVLVVAILMYRAGLTLALTPAALAFALVFAMLGAIRWRCRHPLSQRARVARDAAEYVGLSTAISLVGAIASYPVAAFSHGFADAALQRCDDVLRFDWLAWYRFTAAHPLLQSAGRAAYAMIYVSPAILLGHYAIAGKRREAYDFMAAVWVSALLTLIGFRFMPAVGPFAYLWHGPIPYLPVSDLWQPDVIPKLRAHSFGAIDLGHLVGLVSAPSFHAAAATLLIAFSARERGLRVPLVAANVAMLLSTPVEGTHYLIDLILGAMIALLALRLTAAARRVDASAPESRPRSALAMVSRARGEGRAPGPGRTGRS